MQCSLCVALFEAYACAPTVCEKISQNVFKVARKKKSYVNVFSHGLLIQLLTRQKMKKYV